MDGLKILRVNATEKIAPGPLSAGCLRRSTCSGPLDNLKTREAID